MSSMTLILIALGLALDAFAVSITSGITIHKLRLHHAMRIALFFGIFQAVMPILGWQCGLLAQSFIADYDHWVAFILLGGVGAKMIYEALQHDEEKTPANPLKFYTLLALAIATSIDAFAVGVTLSCLQVSIMRPALVIGSITFVLSLAGTYIGDFFGHLFENKLEIAGGLILIGLGLKILIEHTILGG